MKSTVIVLALGVTACSGTRLPTNVPNSPAHSRAAITPLTPAEQIALKVYETHAKRNRTYQVRFKQGWVKVGQYESLAWKRGLAFLGHGGQYVLRYDNGDRIVSNGARNLIYEYERQRASVRAADCMLETIAFLYAEGSLLNGFKTRLLLVKDIRYDGHILEAVPRRPSNAYKEIILFIEPKDFSIRRSMILTPEGDLLSFHFEKWQPVAGIENELSFRPPPGTRWTE